jgi:phospho-N-acetylmuramoyl-pentapeptide-transferase
MFFWLHQELSHLFGPFNVIRYISFRALAAAITALVITWLLYPWLIRRLQRLHIGQTIREDGPQSHLVKAGTPTMGGLLMVIAVCSSVLLWGDLHNIYVVLTLALMVLFGAIGFLDDAMKLVRGKAKGLRAKTKMGLQLTVALGVFGAFFYLIPSTYDTHLYFPFLRADRYFVDLPAWVYLIFATLVVVGTSNALNLTDGLDGLATGPTITAAGVFMVLAYVSGATIAGLSLPSYLLIPSVVGANELAVFCAALAGAAMGFLWYNCHPASVFMGDVGSLSLGAGLGAVAVFTKNEFLSVIVEGIFVLEAVSVILQTTSYKLRHKRVFRMAPIHHHFELKGVPEPKVIVRFWIVSILLALVALATLKLR